MTTTARAIRDLMTSAITALTPTSLSSDRYKLYREDQVTFATWAGQNPQACFRWFSVLDTGVRAPPSVMTGNNQRDLVRFQLQVGYPITNRYGQDAGRSLDDVMEEDQRQLEHAVGPFGSVTFGIDTTPLVLPDQTPSWDRVDVDGLVMLVGSLAFEFWRTAP
jgi:hypothetical protein